jgi:uncharacterized membrane protein
VFEFLFKYPTTVFRKGELVFASGWPGWLLAIAIVAAGAGLAWHLSRNPGRVEGRRLYVLGALQAAVVALALLMLWQPAVNIQSLRSQQNIVSLLVDSSRSMALPEGEQTRLEQVRAALDGGLLEALQEKFRVRLYSFSNQLERLPSPEAIGTAGPSTRIGESVASLLGESTVVPLGAVVVFSDGSDNSGSFDRRLMAEIRQRNVPVHTVGVGRTEIPEDIELTDLTVATQALPRSQINAQATIRHSGARQLTTRLRVRDGTSILGSKTITLRRGESVQTEWIDFNAGEPGVRNLRFTLDAIEGEDLLGNNVQFRVVDVPRGTRSVLYIEGEPRWEYKFMRRAITKDESVRLVTMLRTTPNKFYRQGVQDQGELVDGFPATAEELFKYDALIIGSIEAASFTPKQQELIREFVSRRGGTLMMLAGRKGLGDGGWGVSKVADVLPARLPETSQATFHREKVRVELTPQGSDSLICRLDEDPDKNREQWKGLTEIADYQRIGDLKPAAIPLLNAQVAGKPIPLLTLQHYGRGKAIIFATGGTWRWKMGLPHDDTRHHTFWQQLLRSLAANSPATLAVSTDRSVYADEPRVKLRAEVRTAAYEPASNATVSAVVTPDSGDPVTVEMRPSPEEEAVFEAEITAAGAGAYRAEVHATIGEESLGSAAVHFRREDGVAEDFHPEQNRELLEKLAGQTQGRYWTLDDIAGLPQEIRFSEAGITARETLDLWDMPFFFLLLLGLKAAEWLLRRKWGCPPRPGRTS